MGGSNIAGNPANVQEDDATLSAKIRSIELIKHNPQMFYLSFFDVNNHWDVAGGAKTFAFALVGGLIGYSYFMNGQRGKPFNYYVQLHMGFARFMFGSAIGGGFGYLKFGDRQKLHNAYVAERLRRRYPESKSLATADLWQFKGVPASQEYYRWR